MGSSRNMANPETELRRFDGPSAREVIERPLLVEIAKLKRDVCRYGDAIALVADHAVDEGDRAYFGSTNHLDHLRKVRQEFFERRFFGGDLDDDLERLTGAKQDDGQ